jgi:hypothetical protein
MQSGERLARLPTSLFPSASSAERGTVQSMATNVSGFEFRLGYEHVPRSKVWLSGWKRVPPEPRLALGGREFSSCFESELRRVSAAGVQTPEIDGELTGDTDDRFLALGTGGTCSFGQHPEPLLHRRILWLEAHHSPSALHQHRAQGPQSAT